MLIILPLLALLLYPLTIASLAQTETPGYHLRFNQVQINTADYDNDGDLDLFVVNMNDTPTLLRNEHGNQHHWLTILTTGSTTNRDAIGTRITAQTPQGKQTRTVNGASSYLSYNDRRVHFGLHDAHQAHIKITWPDASVLDLGIVEANQIIHVVQEKGIIPAD